MARGLKTRFTFAGINPDGIWSPDGNSVIYRSDHDGKFAIYRRAANGAGVEEMLYTDGVNNWPTSSDGKALLFMNTGGPRDGSGPTKSDVFVLPLTPEQPGGPVKPKAFIQTPFAEGRARFSPDGKWVRTVPTIRERLKSSSFRTQDRAESARFRLVAGRPRAGGAMAANCIT